MSDLEAMDEALREVDGLRAENARLRAKLANAKARWDAFQDNLNDAESELEFKVLGNEKDDRVIQEFYDLRHAVDAALAGEEGTP